MKSSNIGYPRIDEQRKWKQTLEGYWAGEIDENAFDKQMEQIRLSRLQKQKEKGIDLIPVGDFTVYDHVLDTAVMFGLVPKRFDYSKGTVPLETYFSIARGNQTAVASEMTKWFNTNYHYIVPELDEFEPTLTENKPLQAYREAKRKLGIEGKPVLIGPYTFLRLSKGYDQAQFHTLVKKLIPLYVQILHELAIEGVKWVQIDEPYLVTSVTMEEMDVVQSIYQQIHHAVPDIRIMLQTYFDSVSWYQEIVRLPVQGIGLDFVHGLEENIRQLKKYGFPKDKVLGIGLIDGRNIWRSDLEQKWELVEFIGLTVDPDRIWLQPSCSLLHVPVTVKTEDQLPSELKDGLAFADEKLEELTILVRAFCEGKEKLADVFAKSQTALRQLAKLRKKKNCSEKPKEEDFHRNVPFQKRMKQQQLLFQLPLLPTTTIGSFPQTAEVRQARRKWRTGEWTDERYEAFIRKQIEDWIAIQEEIGLDVLVHGEFERTDMVEFFGEKLGGFAFTKNGWIQSYGSRVVKPPVIYGDVEFLKPMTVKETQYAQSLTHKPVKGILTGPVTILQWSFVRDDLPRKEVAFQLALALRKEVEALELAGIQMIQVDEPALGEGLPLKKSAWNDYLDWAVKAFRLTTSSVKETTQIHTHMCYCDFHQFIGAIRDLDADVISIETSRSHGELVETFVNHTYDQGIGLGVYDIHSPRVPSIEEIQQIIQRGIKVFDPTLFWINPDCGLKTRGKTETIASLKNMVAATRLVRKQLAVQSI